MKKTALLALVLVAVSSPSLARSHHYLRHHHYAERQRRDQRVSSEKPAGAHAGITCEMVRAYVAQVGLDQARAVAKAAGMTASQERRARHCLETGA